MCKPKQQQSTNQTPINTQTKPQNIQNTNKQNVHNCNNLIKPPAGVSTTNKQKFKQPNN